MNDRKELKREIRTSLKSGTSNTKEKSNDFKAAPVVSINKIDPMRTSFKSTYSNLFADNSELRASLVSDQAQNDSFDQERWEVYSEVNDIIHSKGRKTSLYFNQDVVLIDLEYKQDISLFEGIREIVIASFPITMSLLFVFLLETINIMYIGKLNNSELLASIGLGTTWVNLTGTMPLLGIQGGIDTLCSASFGAKEYRLVGIYTSISRFVTMFYVIFIFYPLTLLAPTVLVAMGQSEGVVENTNLFIRSMIIPIIFVGQREVLSRYLQSMLIFKPPMFMTFITLCLHPVWANLFIFNLNYGIEGAGFALAATQISNVVLLAIYVIFSNSINRETVVLFNKGTFTWLYLKAFLGLCIPATFLIMIESLAYQILIIFSSLLGVNQMSATVCLYNIGSIVGISLIGLGNAVGSFVGNCVGTKNSSLAYTYVKGALIYSVFLGGAIQIFVFFYKREIIELYTTNEAVIDVFMTIVPYYNIFVLFDILVLAMGGIVRGLGRQKVAAKALLGITYLFGIPLSIFITFYLKKGVSGLWGAQTMIVISLFIAFLYIYKSRSIESTIEMFEIELEHQRRGLQASELGAKEN